MISLIKEEVEFLRTGPTASLADSACTFFHHPDGDHLTLLNIWSAFKLQKDTVCREMKPKERFEHLYLWCQEHYLDYDSLQNANETFVNLLCAASKEMKKPLREILPASRSTWQHPEFSRTVRKVLLKGGFLNIAVRYNRDDGYRTLGENTPGLIHPASAIVDRNADIIMYDNFMKTRACYFFYATAIDSQWLFEDPTSSAYVNYLLGKYANNSNNWLPINYLRAAKAKFDRNHGTVQ